MIKDAAGREWTRQDIEILSREIPDGSGYLAARLLLLAYDRVEALEGALDISREDAGRIMHKSWSRGMRARGLQGPHDSTEPSRSAVLVTTGRGGATMPDTVLDRLEWLLDTPTDVRIADSVLLVHESHLTALLRLARAAEEVKDHAIAEMTCTAVSPHYIVAAFAYDALMTALAPLREPAGSPARDGRRSESLTSCATPAETGGPRDGGEGMIRDECCDACQRLTSGDCGMHGPRLVMAGMALPSAPDPRDAEIAALRADLRALAHAATDVVRHFPAGLPEWWEDRLVEALARPGVRAVMEGRDGREQARLVV